MRVVRDDEPVIFRLRRGTEHSWATKNPVLQPGEPGFVLGKGNFKIGDGRTRWNDLEYFLDGTDPEEGDDSAAMQALQDHIMSATPHPSYDDGQSFLLLYQNAKV